MGEICTASRHRCRSQRLSCGRLEAGSERRAHVTGLGTGASCGLHLRDLASSLAYFKILFSQTQGPTNAFIVFCVSAAPSFPKQSLQSLPQSCPHCQFHIRQALLLHRKPPRRQCCGNRRPKCCCSQPAQTYSRPSQAGNGAEIIPQLAIQSRLSALPAQWLGHDHKTDEPPTRTLPSIRLSRSHYTIYIQEVVMGEVGALGELQR